MIPLTLAEIARAVDGTVHGTVDPGLTVTGPVVIDSREVTAGALFAAIVGARSDGHDFARAAYAAGAVAVLGSRPVDGPCVVADDVVTALTKLAGLVRGRLSPVVIGLTGSVGKTTTKDLLAQILEGEAPTVATSRSFNNEIGLPLTILRADRQTRYLVLEMGAAKPGDITHLVRVARPRIGLVLNVGPAHVLTMGGIDGVAKTKGEMVRDLPAAAQGGSALLNADDERVVAMARQTPAAVTFYGTGKDAAVRARDVTLDAAGRASFTLHTPGAQAPVRLRLPGEPPGRQRAGRRVRRACRRRSGDEDRGRSEQRGAPLAGAVRDQGTSRRRHCHRRRLQRQPGLHPGGDPHARHDGRRPPHDRRSRRDDAPGRGDNPSSRGHRRAGGRAWPRRPRGGGSGRRTGRHDRRRPRGRRVRVRRAGW